MREEDWEEGDRQREGRLDGVDKERWREGEEHRGREGDEATGHKFSLA